MLKNILRKTAEKMITEGIINLNKPRDMTSHRCVSAMRKILGIKRIGHTGTLDPQTSGVLPICIGSTTRIMEYLDLDFKKYRAEMILGLVTETQDIWGEVIVDKRNQLSSYDITKEAIIKTFAPFSGTIEQVPPKYSAIRVDGKRLYEYARAGEHVEIKKRNVFIKDIFINEIDTEAYKISFDVECSKGTYIRTICNDIGEALGCGGAMSSLIRLSSGIFTIDDAVSLEELAKMSIDEIKGFVKDADFPLVHFGKAIITQQEKADWFVNGGHIAPNEVFVEREPEYASKEPPFEIREEYKKAYNLYVRNDGKDVFLGVAFYNDKYNKLVADKVFSRSSDIRN
jgi:tRNA pseudouridine55 synthase